MVCIYDPLLSSCYRLPLTIVTVDDQLYVVPHPGESVSRFDDICGAETEN